MSLPKYQGLSSSQFKHTTFSDLNISTISVKNSRKKDPQKHEVIKKYSSCKKKQIKNQISVDKKYSKDKSKQQQKSIETKIKNHDKNCVKKNYKNVKCHSNRSHDNLQMRLPWGVNQPKLSNYVIQTMIKMHNMRKQKKQHVLHSQRSKKNFKQNQKNQPKYQVTPKKQIKQSNSQKQKKQQQKTKIDKHQKDEQKTDKKIKQRKKRRISSSQQNQTQKQYKKKDKIQQTKNKQKSKKIYQFIFNSFNRQFQCLQKNNLFLVNYRIVQRNIIQIQVVILKKVNNMTINLNKGSLDCQSISQIYQNVVPKCSIILMSAVSGVKKQGKFQYPQLQIIINEQASTFGVQKKILIPMGWIFLVQVLSEEKLKELKMVGKIKNKSVIEEICYKRDILVGLLKIFQNMHIKQVMKNGEKVYTFGFKYCGYVNIIRLIVLGHLCSLQCQSSVGGNTIQSLELLQTLLQI